MAGRGDKPAPRFASPGLARGSAGSSTMRGSERTWRSRVWTIRELLNSSELTAEGKVMRHCVASLRLAMLQTAKLDLVDDVYQLSRPGAGPDH